VAAHAEGLDGIKIAIEAGVDTVEHGCYLDEPTARLMAERGTYLVPTVSVFDVMARAVDASVPAYVREKAPQVAEATKEALRIAKRCGVRIAAGTDAGSPAHPHSGLPLELELYVELGLTPHEAVVSATSVAADALDQPQLGRLVEGCHADVLVVGGDPTEEIGALRRVLAVYVAGERVA
jgi:imidazolonepropionase-like amidohydrolase